MGCALAEPPSLRFLAEALLLSLSHALSVPIGLQERLPVSLIALWVSVAQLILAGQLVSAD
jgi:hypothetical protein